jgi:hypothetical protein
MDLSQCPGPTERAEHCDAACGAHTSMSSCSEGPTCESTEKGWWCT